MQRFSRKRIQWSFLAALVGLACLFGSLPVIPGDGRTPIWVPTVIDEDGSYYLTRDITAPGIILDIVPPAQHVTIDLNGNTLTRTDPGEVIRAVTGPSTIKRTLEIYGGVAWTGAMPAAGQTTVRTGAWQDASVRDFETNGYFDLDLIEVIKLQNAKAAAVSVTGTASDHVTGSIEDVTVVDSTDVGLDIEYGSAMRVSDISVENPFSHGVRVNNCDACQFSNIAVQDAGGNAVRLESTVASMWKTISSMRSSTSGFFIDNVSTGNFFTAASASFSQNGNVGFENHGARTNLNGGTFQGNSGGGIHNLGSEFSVRETNARGNAPPNFQDDGILTYSWDLNSD